MPIFFVLPSGSVSRASLSAGWYPVVGHRVGGAGAPRGVGCRGGQCPDGGSGHWPGGSPPRGEVRFGVACRGVAWGVSEGASGRLSKAPSETVGIPGLEEDHFAGAFGAVEEEVFAVLADRAVHEVAVTD